MTHPSVAAPASPAIDVARALVDNVASVVLGKRDEIALVVAGLLAGGHVLLEDVPGVGKTLLAKSLARSVAGTIGRVQGTADLMPADITGVTVYDRDRRTWEFHPGPVFHNVVLVDEINRATPRAQSALLEAMGEGQVTVDGTPHALPIPFFVIATQNPYGDVGTFPLVEGQCDRLQPVVTGEGLVRAIAAVRATYAAPAIADYVLDVVAATRNDGDLDHGASPRAARTLLDVARAFAAVAGRDFVTPDDVKAVAVAVLAHRVGAVTRRGTEAARPLVHELVARVPVPAV
jgi:MoxR-like ATPase